MEKYIIFLFDQEIQALEKFVKNAVAFRPESAFPDRIDKHIEKLKKKISLVEKYKQKYLKNISSIK